MNLSGLPGVIDFEIRIDCRHRRRPWTDRPHIGGNRDPIRLQFLRPWDMKAVAMAFAVF